MPLVEELDGRELNRMRRLFLERMKDDFGDFRDRSGEYWVQERAYKEEFTALVRSSFPASMFGDPSSTEQARAVVETTRSVLTHRLSTIDLPQNLLGWRYAEFLRNLTAAESREYATPLGELLYGQQAHPARVGEFTETLWPVLKRHAGSNPYAQARLLPTLFLMAFYPAEDIAVRTDMFRTAASQLLGRRILRSAPFSAAEYSDILAFSHEILRQLERWGWQPQDMLDVHTFLWVVTRPDYNEDDGDDDE